MTATAQQVYEVRGGAAEVFSTKAREVLVEGPARTGKTRALLEKAYAVARKYPGARILLVRKTRASMSESVLQTLEDFVIAPNEPWLGTAKRTHREAYRLPNGSVIVPGAYPSAWMRHRAYRLCVSRVTLACVWMRGGIASPWTLYSPLEAPYGVRSEVFKGIVSGETS